MSWRARPAKFRRMKFPRPAVLLLLAAVLLTVGCASYPGKTPAKYTMLRVTDHHGAVLAEWVAKGYVSPVEKGYRITAVERLSGPPHPIRSKYPDGWRTTVTGPHILSWPCGEPYWLYQLNNE